MPIFRHVYLIAPFAAALIGCGSGEEPAKAVEPAAKPAAASTPIPAPAAAALSVGGSPFASTGAESQHAPPAPPPAAK